MTAAEWDDLERLAQAANDDIGVQYSTAADEWLVRCDKPTMQLLRKAPEAVPALITEVRSLRARLAAVEALIRDYRRALREDEGELISWSEHNLTRLYDAIDDALETNTTKEN